MYPMLNTLPYLTQSQLPTFLSTLTPLATSHPQLFAPHLHNLLKFLPGLIIPSSDPGPTPTVARPNPAGGSSFVFPPPTVDKGKGPATGDLGDDEEAEEVRKAALEFMISLSEARPMMVKRVDGWTSAIVRGCLSGMGEIPEDETDTWLDADVGSRRILLIHLLVIGSLYSIFSTSPSRLRILQTILIPMCMNKNSIG